MSGCPLGYGSPENSSELEARADRIEVPRDCNLSSERVISSIPNRDGKWAYPSPVQFYKNAAAKGHSLDPDDMDAVVGIHNAVNEETWARIVEIERRLHGKECSAGPKLVRFVGKPGEASMKARAMHFVGGYVMPFDRHEWTIDRCGTGLFNYDVDFYDGPYDLSGKVNIHIDVRPSLKSFSGFKDRLLNLVNLLIR